MRKIYTGIDIGSDTIKIVVSEFIKNKFHVLASTSTKSYGIKKGLIVDYEKALDSLNCALDDIENILGTRINKAVVTVPSNERRLQVVEGKVTIYKDKIDGEDVTAVLQEAAVNNVQEGEEFVSIIPISFGINGEKSVANPNGMQAETLNVKALLATAPRSNIFSFLQLFNDALVEVADITFNCIGDYYEVKNTEKDAVLGAVINVGHEKTDISIFNKGILIKNSIINLGSKNIDKDISYIYGVNLEEANELKEKFAVASTKFADNNEQVTFETSNNEKITINQLDITQVVEARINELLKLIKNEINNLTKRKISYIIVTGGISELMGFSYLVENVLGVNSSTLNTTTIGIRNNKYSSAIGIIKYFHDKMNLREKDVSLIDEDSLNNIMKNKKSMLEMTDETITSKIYGCLSGN